MNWSRSLYALIAVVLLGVAEQGSICRAEWQVGLARADITPRQFMPMAGYASRGRTHATGQQTPLWAKACVLQGENGTRAVLITLDLVGIDRSLSERLATKLADKHGLSRSQLVVNCSHTHSGPVVQGNLRPMYQHILTAEDQMLVQHYVELLEQQLVQLVDAALKDLQSAQLSWGSGIATFAVNRRNNPEKDVPELRARGELKGPVDHAVPVLKISRGEQLAAVVFGYACHNTTLAGMDWSGDYAGYAQMELEAALPGTMALYWAGCGADQNPIPRREVAQAREYGRQLAKAVQQVLAVPLQNVTGDLRISYGEIPLPFDKLPSEEQLRADAGSTNIYIASRAQSLLEQLASGAPLSPTYPFPASVWRLGNDLHWVFLGGEVVVDYALRLKAELSPEESDRSQIWVAGYSHDVLAYIPSLRVLSEGGYEGGGAMVYYGLPAPWAPEVETLIIQQVLKQAEQVSQP